MNATQTARQAIHEQVRDEIRFVSMALTKITAETAYDNWEYLFQQCRFQEAKKWWAIYEQLRSK